MLVLGDAWKQLEEVGEATWTFATSVDWLGIIASHPARAVGMLIIVWITIWVIALVYSGYAQDSEIGPVGVRPHTNRRLGEGKIVFDQTLYKFQMDGVEATCRFYFVYDDFKGRTKKIPLGEAENLKLHIRSSAIPRSVDTHFGFEGPDDLPWDSVVYPPFVVEEVPSTIDPTPVTIGEYIEKHDLITKWTDDDDAPVVSIGSTRWELLTDLRREFIRDRARKLRKARTGNLIDKMNLARALEERPNVFGNYHIKIQFPKDPLFVLFRHPNAELKMTAWLTILTSIFALAMDAWPVDGHQSKRAPARIPVVELTYPGASSAGSFMSITPPAPAHIQKTRPSPSAPG